MLQLTQAWDALYRPGDVPHTAREAEEAGLGALWVPETKHDLSCPWRLRLNMPNAYAWGLPWRLPSRS
jgi:hypothetical protein